MGRPKDGSAQALALASLALPLHARGASCCRGARPAGAGGHACAAQRMHAAPAPEPRMAGGGSATRGRARRDPPLVLIVTVVVVIKF